MTLRNCVRPTFLLLAAAVRVISLAIAVYVAHPKIEISPQSAILENGRREAPFRVKNDGVFALFDVASACLLEDVRYEDNVVADRDTMVLGRDAEVLRRGEATTIACRGFTPNPSVVEANVTVSVDFSANLWPKHLTMVRRFAAVRGRDGVLQWWPKGATGEIEPAASIR